MAWFSATLPPMLRHRLALGPVLIAAVIGGLWLDERLDASPIPESIRFLFGGRADFPPGCLIFLALLLILFFASRELARILADNGIAGSKRVTTSAAYAGLLVCCLVPHSLDGVTAAALVSSAAVIVLIGSLMFYSRKRTFEGVVAAAGGTLLAFVYLGLMLGFILTIRREHPAWIVLWVILVTKSSDIGAFFTGITIGRHKLIPWLSPGKTWEGLAGGVVFAALVGAAGAWVLERAGVPRGPGVVRGALAGGVFAVVGQAGDLAESLFKRDAGIKDSGRSVPGFGGVLDLLDSILMVAPVAYWMLRVG